jgi:hypothetical protein
MFCQRKAAPKQGGICANCFQRFKSLTEVVQKTSRVQS